MRVSSVFLTSHQVFQCQSPGSGSLNTEALKVGVRDTPVAPSEGSMLVGLLGGWFMAENDSERSLLPSLDSEIAL